MKSFVLNAFDHQYPAHFVLSNYSYGNGLYVGIELEDGDPWGDLSTNLDFDLPENCIAIKEYEFGKEYLQLLSELDCIVGELGNVTQGYGNFKIVLLDYDKLLEYGYVLG